MEQGVLVPDLPHGGITLLLIVEVALSGGLFPELPGELVRREAIAVSHEEGMRAATEIVPILTDQRSAKSS